MTLNELQRLAEGATPGPWEADYAGEGSSGKFRMTECFVRRPGDNISIAADVCTPAGRPCIENAEFIAAMREAVPKLIAVARAADDYCAAFTTALDLSESVDGGDFFAATDKSNEAYRTLRNALEELK